MDKLRQGKYTKDAAIIGEVTAEMPGRVVMSTEIGAETLLPEPRGELLRESADIRVGIYKEAQVYLQARSDSRGNREDGMDTETRIAVLSIIVENTDTTAELNDIIHEYAEYMVGAMGIPYRARGLISSVWSWTRPRRSSVRCPAVSGGLRV